MLNYTHKLYNYYLFIYNNITTVGWMDKNWQTNMTLLVPEPLRMQWFVFRFLC